MTGLFIVDIQEWFLQDTSSQIRQWRISRLVRNTVRAIRKVREINGDVVCIEYRGCGPTHPKIMGELHKGSFDLVIKERDGICLYHKLSKYEKAIFCGINLDCCVESTIEASFSSRCPSLNILLDAVDTAWLDYDRMKAYSFNLAETLNSRNSSNKLKVLTLKDL